MKIVKIFLMCLILISHSMSAIAMPMTFANNDSSEQHLISELETHDCLQEDKAMSQCAKHCSTFGSLLLTEKPLEYVRSFSTLKIVFQPINYFSQQLNVEQHPPK